MLIMPVLLVASATGGNLINNGRFEQGLLGWTLAVDSVDGSWTAVTGPEYDADTDCEVFVEKVQRYSTWLFQSAVLPGLDVSLLFRARLAATVARDTPAYYAHAAVVLEYQNAAGEPLGATMVVRKTTYSPLNNTPTRRLISASSEDWFERELVIRDELSRLSGVNPTDVARVVVGLQAWGNGVGG